MATVLVVDDSAVERRRAGALLEKRAGGRAGEERAGLRVVYASHGREALDAVRQGGPDLVVTDLQMPEMDGLELVKQVRATHPAVPVVLMTAHGSEEIASQALRIGAAGYVPKKTLARDLRETVENILTLNETAREQQYVLQHLTESEVRFVLPNDLALVGPLLTFFQTSFKRLGLCDPAGNLRVTIAVREALVNAITHGNLEVPSELKDADGLAYHRALEEHARRLPYRDRRVHVAARETPAEVRYVIRDEGPGFNPAELPDPTDPANLEKAGGRGLFLIRAFVDEVKHNDAGNEITLVKRRDG